MITILLKAMKLDILFNYIYIKTNNNSDMYYFRYKLIMSLYRFLRFARASCDIRRAAKPRTCEILSLPILSYNSIIT